MRFHRFWVLGLLAALLSAGATQAAFAQENPPTRVGRLSYIGGSVSFEPAGTDNWAAAELNRPVTIGDRIWTDWDSRAEVELGDAVVRLGSRTGFSFLNLDALTAQMQLTAGTIIVHVRTLADGEQDEVDTPNLALALEQPGTYRVHVDSSGDTTRVEVIDGEALASGGGQTFPVAAQESATFTGTDTLNVDYATLGVPDALDEWSMARDRQEAQAATDVTNYVSPDMVGVYDLNTYGSWQDTQWGYAWFPNVVVGWAPYRFGHWVWIFPWGWTWVDDEPWGFAPFHYGRWGYWHNAWCWVPGPRNVRPVYAPALVAWTRGGHPRGPRPRPHPGEHVGWVPLGPRDVYLPGYAASRGYVRDVNLTNARDLSAASVTQAYRRHGADLSYANRHVPGAVTVIPRTAFSASQPADAHRMVFTRRGLLKVRFGPGTPAVTPSRSNVFGARVHTLQVPPRQLTHRPVVARLLPARAGVSFARQQAAIRANGGRMLTSPQWARLRPNTPVSAVRLAPDVRPAARGSERGRPRSGFADRPAPARSPVPQVRPAPQRPPRPGAPPRYHSDRPVWAQSPNERRNGPTGRSQERPRHVNPERGVPRYRIAQPQPQQQQQQHVPLPQRYVPQPQQHVPLPQRHVPQPQQHVPLPQRHVPRPQYRSPPQRHANPPPNPRAVRERPPLAAASLWQSAPPMYRAQEIAAPQHAVEPSAIPSDYAPPRSPPPMYRPVAPRFMPHVVASSPPAPAYRPARAQVPRAGRPHLPLHP